MGTATAIAQECGILPPPGASVPDWLASHAAATAATRAGGGWAPESARAAGGPSAIIVPRPRSGKDASVHALSAALASRTVDHPGSRGGDPEALPDGVVMEGAEFRRRVLRDDGSIDEGACPLARPGAERRAAGSVGHGGRRRRRRGVLARGVEAGNSGGGACRRGL